MHLAVFSVFFVTYVFSQNGAHHFVTLLAVSYPAIPYIQRYQPYKQSLI